MGLGYLAATGIFALLLLALVATQVTARRFHPALYWATIIASTTTGTTLADFSTRSLGIGYIGGSLMLISFVLASLAAWRATLGRIAADDIRDRRAELFYWLTITFSQTLGTALGDWLADTGGLGYVVQRSYSPPASPCWRCCTSARRAFVPYLIATDRHCVAARSRSSQAIRARSDAPDQSRRNRPTAVGRSHRFRAASRWAYIARACARNARSYRPSERRCR